MEARDGALMAEGTADSVASLRAKSPQEKRPFVEKAYEYVRDRIIDFSLRPGESITDGAIAANLGISRTPAREAMRRLEREGLLFHTPHRGWRVRTLEAWDIEEIFELKECLEAILVRQATQKMTAETAAALREITAHMEDAAARRDRQAWLAADAAWHDVLYAAAHNMRAKQIISSINAQWRCMQAGLMAMQERMGQSAEEHRAILERVLAGDAEGAARLIQEQIARTRRYLVILLNDFVMPFTTTTERH
jgi:DNA-binding GntR family transcriptional regulator